MKRDVAAIDLDAAPEVDELLTGLGVGTMVRDSVTSPIGRNDAWAGPTTSGREVFVKRLTGARADVEARLRRMLAFEEYAKEARPPELFRPAFLGADSDRHIVAFERVVDAENGAQLMVDEVFTGEQAYRIGRVIGRLHGTPPVGTVEVEQVAPPFPPVPFLRGLPMSVYVRSSAGELEAWRLLQNDDVLVRALERLREWEADAPRVPSHCDFRVDQLLVRPEAIYVADWEEFRLADPARDVGAFAGEWIYRSVLDLVTNRGDDVFVDMEFTHDMVLRRGAEKMRRLLPLVGEFWRGYRDVLPEVDETLAVRATAFAGWHLLDRLVAGALSTSRLTGIQRAAAGVGRAAVVNPERFAATLGFVS
ncbi:class V lanthionine synthetase subunit LxmK [Streptomyces sp. NPDC101115]|uniref:class V lanthionine synthetase subunit LxmK n=1 Tax=Streptomyces sp. NPDC101115 TaxID=3366106 RepID=UPI0038071305